MDNRADSLAGRIEYHSPELIQGWAFDRSSPNQSISVQVYADGQLVDEISPDVFRWDLEREGFSDGCHGFTYRVSAKFLDGACRRIHFKFAGTDQELDNSPIDLHVLAEGRYAPFKASRLVGARVLVLAPHPDDESLGCGGSLALHANNSDPIKVVFLTDGVWGEESHAHDPEEYMRLRESEASKACEILGGMEFEFWRIPDRQLAEAHPIWRLCELIETFKPSLIYAPSPMETHPDHRAAAALAWEAVQRLKCDVQVAFYELGCPVGINTLVDITRVAEQKSRACNGYESQLQYHPYTDCVMGLNRYRSLTISAAAAYAEGFLVLDSSRIRERPIELFSVAEQRPSLWEGLDPAPLVSVIVRTKDRPALLRHALSSLVCQTYPNIEIIVVNDGGEDVSVLVEEFGKYRPVQHVAHKTSKGPAAAGNAGLAEAKGKYINFLDDDDLLYANHVAKLVTFLEATGQQFAYSDCEEGLYEWGPNGAILQRNKTPCLGSDFERVRLYFNNYIRCMTAMFRRDLLDETGTLDESFDYLEDWDLWIRMAQHTDLRHVPGVTAEYRKFGKTGWDNRKWTLKIYEKHKSFWDPEKVVNYIWPRIEALEEMVRDLRASNGSTNSQSHTLS